MRKMFLVFALVLSLFLVISTLSAEMQQEIIRMG